jgi:hypothetical protein
MGLNGYVTAPVLSRNQAALAQFWGLNLRAGLQTPWLPAPWSLGLFGGFYYASMIVNPPEFGFSGLRGPEVLVTLERMLGAEGDGGQKIGGYLKFSPLSQDFGSLSAFMQEREWALGLSYRPGWIPGLIHRPLSLTLDLAQLKLTPFDQGVVESRSVSLGVSTDFPF